MRNIFFFALVIVLLSSCKTLVPFTSELSSENRWGERELESIQFYVSEQIVLQRQLKSGEVNIVSGKIKDIEGRKVEEIIIRKGTPGIATAFPDENRIAISFEISDDYYLTFGIDPKRGSRYYLRLKEYEKNQYAKVTYHGETFVISHGSLSSYLMVNMKKIKKLKRNQRVVKGRKV